MVSQKLEQLKRRIARQREILTRERQLIDETRETKALQRELAILKSPGKRQARETISRFKQGFKVLSRKGKVLSIKVGKSIIKQARLIKEQQERDAREDRKRIHPMVKKVKRKLKRIKSRRKK